MRRGYREPDIDRVVRVLCVRRRIEGPPRPAATRRLARPFTLVGLAVALCVLVLSRVVGFGTSPQTAFLFIGMAPSR